MNKIKSIAIAFGSAFIRVAFGSALIAPQLCFAQSSAGAHHRPDSILGGGIAQLNVVSPHDVTLGGSGAYITVTAEKPFGALPLYLDAQISYFHSTGKVNYNYISSTSVDYTASQINVAADGYNASLGLKLKFLENYGVRPYLEGGGVGGYMQFTYDNTLRTPAVLALGSDFKTIDGALNFGFFAEAGVDVSILPWMSVNLAYKYMDATSQPFVTVKNQTVHYVAAIYYGGIVFKY